MQVKKGNVKATNAPSAGGGGSAKKSSGGMGLMIGAAIVVVIVIIIVSMSGGKSNQPQTTDTNVQQFNPTQASGGGTRVYEQNERTSSTLNDQNQEAATAGAMPELEYYIDPVTGQEMVKTPNGPLVKGSPEGVQYIEDYERLRLEANGGNPTAAAPSNNVQKAELEQLAAFTNQQIQALDEKIISQQEYIDQLTTLVKRQNESIASMSSQVKTIQPIVKSSGDLAKEFFGKGGEKVLANRNASIEALSIVGDKAWVINGFGKESLVKVGDIVPGTSTKIKQIDASQNIVVVAQ